MRELNFATETSLRQGLKDVYPQFREEVESRTEEAVRVMLQQTVEIEADEQLQAHKHERSAERIDYRAGYRQRTVITSKGTYSLRVPRARSTPLNFSVFDRYQRLWRRVHQVLQQVFLGGCSTRRTGEVLKLLLGTQVSAQTVSRAVQALDPLVRAFHRRRLEDQYRWLILDGVAHRVRQTHHKKKIVLVAYGITTTGHREIIDFLTVPSESYPAWYGFLNRLFHRGLIGDTLEMIVSDGCGPLAKAIQEVYPQVPHGTCWAHKLRNVAEKVDEADERKVTASARQIYLAPNRKKARTAFRRWRNRWIDSYPEAVKSLERELDRLLVFFDQPEPLRKTLRTTNLIERSFVEVRRRTRPMRSFANVKSLERITYALVIYANSKWEKLPLPEFAHNS
jgi:transposase-like protein